MPLTTEHIAELNDTAAALEEERDARVRRAINLSPELDALRTETFRLEGELRGVGVQLAATRAELDHVENLPPTPALRRRTKRRHLLQVALVCLAVAVSAGSVGALFRPDSVGWRVLFTVAALTVLFAGLAVSLPRPPEARG